jgi:hypothetical protein
MPSRNDSPPPSASRRTRSQCASTSPSRSRSSSTHCPRSRTSPPADARSRSTSAAVSRSSPRPHRPRGRAARPRRARSASSRPPARPPRAGAAAARATSRGRAPPAPPPRRPGWRAGSGAPRPGPGHRLVDRAGIDQLGQPGALLGGTLQRHQQVEQRLPVAARGRFLERPGQRTMLHRAPGAGARRVGREEGERMVLVAAVLGQVQAHLADDVPRGVTRAQPLGDGPVVRADLVGERAVDVGPARGDPVGVDVLAAIDRWDGPGQPCALVRRAVDLDALAPIFQVGRAHSRVTNARPRSRRNARAGARGASSSVAPRSRRAWPAPRAKARARRARAAADSPSLASSSPGAVSASSVPDGRMATRIGCNPSAAT